MHSTPSDIIIAITATFILKVPNFTILNSQSFIPNAFLKQNSSLATLKRLLVS